MRKASLFLFGISLCATECFRVHNPDVDHVPRQDDQLEDAFNASAASSSSRFRFGKKAEAERARHAKELMTSFTASLAQVPTNEIMTAAAPVLTTTIEDVKVHKHVGWPLNSDTQVDGEESFMYSWEKEGTSLRIFSFYRPLDWDDHLWACLNGAARKDFGHAVRLELSQSKSEAKFEDAIRIHELRVKSSCDGGVDAIRLAYHKVLNSCYAGREAPGDSPCTQPEHESRKHFFVDWSYFVKCTTCQQYTARAQKLQGSMSSKLIQETGITTWEFTHHSYTTDLKEALSQVDTAQQLLGKDYVHFHMSFPRPAPSTGLSKYLVALAVYLSDHAALKSWRSSAKQVFGANWIGTHSSADDLPACEASIGTLTDILNVEDPDVVMRRMQCDEGDEAERSMISKYKYVAVRAGGLYRGKNRQRLDRLGYEFREGYRTYSYGKTMDATELGKAVVEVTQILGALTSHAHAARLVAPGVLLPDSFVAPTLDELLILQSSRQRQASLKDFLFYSLHESRITKVSQTAWADEKYKRWLERVIAKRRSENKPLPGMCNTAFWSSPEEAMDHCVQLLGQRLALPFGTWSSFGCSSSSSQRYSDGDPLSLTGVLALNVMYGRSSPFYSEEAAMDMLNNPPLMAQMMPSIRKTLPMIIDWQVWGGIHNMSNEDIGQAISQYFSSLPRLEATDMLRSIVLHNFDIFMHEEHYLIAVELMISTRLETCARARA